MIFNLKKGILTTIVILAGLLSQTPLMGFGYSFGIGAGIQPNAFSLNQSTAEVARQLNKKVESRNAARQQTAESAGVTGKKIEDAKIQDTSSSVYGIPVGINLRLLERFYLIRLGMAYQFSVGGLNSMLIDRCDSDFNCQDDNGRLVSIAYSTRQFEFPVTFALNLKNDPYSRLYAGAGLTLFYGSLQMEKSNGNDQLSPDYDVFSGWTLGYHLMMGGELSFAANLSLSAEIFFNIGRKAPVEDSLITKAGKKDITDGEDENNPEILGVYAQDRALGDAVFDPRQPDGLVFTGMELMLGINFYY